MVKNSKTIIKHFANPLTSKNKNKTCLYHAYDLKVNAINKIQNVVTIKKYHIRYSIRYKSSNDTKVAAQRCS